MLGAFGQTELTGKPVGDDLREGKPTPLLARARQAATTQQLGVLELVGTNLSSSDVAAIQTVFTETGAVSTIEDQIDVLTTEALDAISRTPLAGDASARLGELATFLATRSS